MTAGRLAAALSRRLGRGEGGVIGGRVTLALDPAALTHLAAGRRVAMVTGTNGKTTTAALLATALRTAGAVAHNASGANMADGALAALATAPRAPWAVLEVDELHLPRIAAAVRPDVVVLLNLSRDQLDRSWEVRSVATALRAALLEHPETLVVANGEDPVVAATVTGLPHVRWFSGTAGRPSDAALCPACGGPVLRDAGGWQCTGCELSRPAPHWALAGDGARGPSGDTVRLRVDLPGDYNRHNALAAVAAADALGVPAAAAAKALAGVRSVAHRYAVLEHGAHRLTLLLAKNPAGWHEALMLARTAASLLLVVNAEEADGRDTSWLWDVPFERLDGAPTAASGRVAADLGLRLTYAGIDHHTEPDPLAALAGLPEGDVTVVANYTAFAALARRLECPA